MTANNNKVYLDYLKKWLYQYYNISHHSVNKTSINTDYSTLTENIKTNLKPPKLKVNFRIRVNKYKNVFIKSYIENWSSEIFIINSVLKTNA